MRGTNASSMLREAADIVAGARNQTHGDKERSFLAIAQMWNAYLTSRRDPIAAIRPVDVALMMNLMKVARTIQGTPIRDHYVDMAGYAAIAGELSTTPPDTDPRQLELPV